MTGLTDYAQTITDAQGETYWRQWKKANPKEYAAWITFDQQVRSATTSAVPTFTPCVTEYARDLRDIAAQYLDTLPTPSVAPPTTTAYANAPTPPSIYSVPTGGTVVSTSAQLIAALASSSNAPIVLENGTYDNPSQFEVGGKQLYAATLGGAVLTAGVESSNGSPVLQGLRFNATDPSKTFQNAAVNLWGTARASLFDCFWDGGGTLGHGVLAYALDGLVMARCQGQNVTLNGFALDDNNPVSTQVIASLTDLDWNGASQYNSGTTGAPIWIGQPCLVAARLRGQNGATCAVWTGNAFAKTTVTDIISLGCPVGVYMEHFTIQGLFDRYDIQGAGIGFNSEWNDGTAGNEAGKGNQFQNGRIASSEVGFSFDQGTSWAGVTITPTNTVFQGQAVAAVAAYLNTAPLPVFNDPSNTYEMQPGAVPVSYDHVG